MSNGHWSNIVPFLFKKKTGVVIQVKWTFSTVSEKENKLLMS